MPLLDWKDYEFIQVLSVVPTNEEGARYTFEVVKGGAKLTLIVWPYESVVGVCVGTDSLPDPLTTFAVFVRGKALLQEYKDECWLELRDCVVAPSRFSYLDWGDPFDRVSFPHGQPIRVWVDPQIRVEWRRANETS